MILTAEEERRVCAEIEEAIRLAQLEDAVE